MSAKLSFCLKAATELGDVDLADLTNRITVNLAGRYEDFSEFGDTVKIGRRGSLSGRACLSGCSPRTAARSGWPPRRPPRRTRISASSGL